MNTRIPLALFALCALLANGSAEDAVIARGTGDRPASARPRINPRFSEAIRASLPAYQPPNAAEQAPEGYASDDDVVVMNPIFVRGWRVPSKIDWESLTDLGRKELLKERYRGAVIPGAALTDAMHNYATQMLNDDQRLAGLAEIDSMLEDARITGQTDGLGALKSDLNRARMRPKDMRAESMDRSYNNDRR